MYTISSYHQTLKIHGKVQLKSDIIFLSDIRLGKRSDDYTFIPKSKDQSNRSRIDFILVSEVLIRFAHECDILPSLQIFQNNLFDHKAVYVNFFVKKITRAAYNYRRLCSKRPNGGSFS